MTARHAVLFLVFSSQLAGCAWLKSRWPWRPKKVPVTPPAKVAPSRPEDQAKPPARVATPASAPAPKAPPETRPVPRTKPAEIVDDRKAEVVAASMVQVNDRFITVDHVLTAARPALIKLPADLTDEAFRVRARRIIDSELEDQVRIALVLVEAEKHLTEDQKGLVAREMKDLRQDLLTEAGGSMTRLKQELASKGFRLPDLLADQERRLKTQFYLQSKFYPAITITRRMLWNYYRRHKSDFSQAKKVQMQIIAVPVAMLTAGDAGTASARQVASARTRAEKMIRQAGSDLAGGEDFTKLAKRLAAELKAPFGPRWAGLPPSFGKVCVDRMARNGGVWALMEAGNFGQVEVERAAFRLSQGRVSQPITTGGGCFLVKARHIRAGKATSFEQAQDRITKKLRRRQYQALRKKYLLGLLEGSRIVQSEKFVEWALDRAVKTRRRQDRPGD